MSADDLSRLSLRELFQQEAETQAQVLTAGLLAIERDPAASGPLEECMRAAHSLKGAARIVGLEVAVRLAHVMEDCFVSAQQGRIVLGHAHVDLLLTGADLLARIAASTDAGAAAAPIAADVGAWFPSMQQLLGASHVITPDDDNRPEPPPIAAAPDDSPAGERNANALANSAPTPERMLRVTAETLNRLLGLASEGLVESRRMKPMIDALLRLKRMQSGAGRTLEDLRETISAHSPDEQARLELAAAQRQVLECAEFLSQRLADLELFNTRSIDLSHRLYDEALACRMSPFADGVQAFPRMVRDLARSLGKRARMEVNGGATQLDRDILSRLDAPLGHILRNAVDHGIETADERRAAGKPVEGLIRLEARHHAGALQVTVSDDGRGVDLDKLRHAIVGRNLSSRDTVMAMSESELLEFLFLPGFSLKDSVTETSGRGVGLDVVRNMVKQVRGTVHVSSRAGQGTLFHLQLPVTLSVLRTLLVEIGGEPYAFPLAAIIRTLKVSRSEVESIEHREHFSLDGRRVGLVTAHQVLAAAPHVAGGDELAVVVIGDPARIYGLIVDRFLGERELVVQRLDPQLGKIMDIAAGALMEDGSPLLVVDTDDLIRSVEKIVSGGRLANLRRGEAAPAERRRKRVLVVDDSLTVRELERKLLASHGYDVDVAVDGMDGWNAVRTGRFDLVVTDIDMPRMDGIELVTLINGDANLKSVPVMVVSYKDRDEDRRRGLEAGAAYYLTKGSFHDETLVQAVVDLIGEADA